MTEKQERSAAVLKKWRELRRDLLFIKYGDEWAKHDKKAGRFWVPPDEQDKRTVEVLMAMADA